MWDVTGKDTCGGPPPVLVLNSGWVGGFPEGSEGYGARQDVGRWTRAQPAPAMPQVSTLAVPRRGREVLCTKPTVAPAPCNTPRLHLGLEHLLLHEGSDTAAYGGLRPGPAPALPSRGFLTPGLVRPPTVQPSLGVTAPSSLSLCG